MAHAEADRPAGTILLPPATLLPAYRLGAALADVSVQTVNTLHYAAVIPVNRHGRLSVDLQLAVAPAAPPLPLARIEVRAMMTPGLRPPSSIESWTGPWDTRTWLPVLAAQYEITPGVTLDAQVPWVTADGRFFATADGDYFGVLWSPN